MVESETRNDITTITLRPNRSSTWSQTRWLILVLCVSTLAVGIFWSLLGAWVVLPFSGLESLVIIVVFYRVSLHTYQRQVITLTGNEITVQAGISYPRRSWHLQRHTTSLQVREAEKPLASIELTLTDRKLQLDLGTFLNGDDRNKALQLLKSAGLDVKRMPRSG